MAMAPTSAVEAISSADSQGKSFTAARGSTATGPRCAAFLETSHWEKLQPAPSYRDWFLHCGLLAKVAYDAFNDDKGSPQCGASRYSKETILEETNFPFPSEYEVVEFLYAIAKPRGIWSLINPSGPCSGSIFQGYIAVSGVRDVLGRKSRDIYVVWRGTRTPNEFLKDLKVYQTSIAPLSNLEVPAERRKVRGGPNVATAWYDVYTDRDPCVTSCFTDKSAHRQLVQSLQDQLQLCIGNGEEPSIHCVGHSLGGALAVLSAYDIVSRGLNTGHTGFLPVFAVVFACPRIGDKAFSDELRKFPYLSVYHVMNRGDIVPSFPPTWTPTESEFYDDIAGERIVLHSKNSQSFPRFKSPVERHYLQKILDSLEGWNGEGRERKIVQVRWIAPAT